MSATKKLTEPCARCGHSKNYKSHTVWRQVWATEAEIPEAFKLAAHVYVSQEDRA
jgi:hypothetical protein